MRFSNMVLGATSGTVNVAWPPARSRPSDGAMAAFGAAQTASIDLARQILVDRADR